MTATQRTPGAGNGPGESTRIGTDAIVEIDDLAYSYRAAPDRRVLDGVSLTVRRGEILGICGRTGSGKSTLCYAMAGLVPHSFGGRMTGRVTVDGVDTTSTTVAALTRHVSLVMQSPESQIVGLTVREDVEFGLENIGCAPEETVERAAWALAQVRLTGLESRSPWDLSGGQKQRLAIAAAIAFHPAVLVLDNPTAELDPMGKEDVLETLVGLNRALGTTIVIVNQELSEIAPDADRLLLLDAGRVAALGTPAEVLDQPDRFHSVGIRLPEVTEIAARLRSAGAWDGPLPIEVPDAVPQLRRRLAGRRAASPAPAAAPAALPEENRAAPAAPPPIRVRDIRFAYPNGSEVLRGVSLEIARGSFVALMGPNGAGKTTLAKHFNGLLRPSSGVVEIDGIDAARTTVARLAARIGYVFQNPDHQVFSETVAEELAFGPGNLGWDTARIDEAVERTLEDLGMSAQRDARPFFLGLAERKLLALGSILIMGPEVLVLDEPATGADHMVALRIMRYISELHARGLTVVIITHDVSLAARYADRLVVVRDGQVVLDGPPPQVFAAREELDRSFVRPPQTVMIGRALDGLVDPSVTHVDAFMAALEGGRA